MSVLLYSTSTIVFVLLIFKIILKFSSGVCKSQQCLLGKTALVTGGSSGVGYQVALALASRGCKVIIASRNVNEEIKKNIIKHTGNPNIEIKRFDLGSLKSVRDLAKDINENVERLDILINNSGTAGLGNQFTSDGLHALMQVNHFGSFLLTHLLIDLLKKSAPSRIIFTASFMSYLHSLTVESLNDPYKISSAKNIFNEVIPYGNSKLCNIITAQGFGERLLGTGVTCNSANPGLVYTDIFNKTLGPYFPLQSAHEGMQTILLLATSEKLKHTTGRYFTDCTVCSPPRSARNSAFCRKIWMESEVFVKLEQHEKLKSI